MIVPAGFAALALGLLAVLVSVHFREGRYFDRPAVARHPWFDPALGVLAWGVIAGGLVTLFIGSPAAAAGAIGVLASLLGTRAWMRSAPRQARLLRRQVAGQKRLRPDLDQAGILRAIARARHPRWGDELIEEMVKEYPTVEEFARLLTRMERGFRGFGSGRSRPRSYRDGRG